MVALEGQAVEFGVFCFEFVLKELLQVHILVFLYVYMDIHTHTFIIETVTMLDSIRVEVQINSQLFTLCTCVDHLFIYGYSSYFQGFSPQTLQVSVTQ